jgi:uncharacterized membrane protein
MANSRRLAIRHRLSAIRDMLLLTLLYVAAGLLLAALAIPMIQRRIKPNPFYGFRTPKTLQNETLWYEVNAYSGKRLLVAGIVVTIAAILVALIPNLTIDVYAILIAIVLAISISVGLLQSFRYLNQIAK